MTDPWAPPDLSSPRFDVQTGPLAPFARATPARRLRADLLVGLAVAAGVLLLAGPVGVVWAAIAPRVGVQVQGPDQFALLQNEPEQFVGADAVFVLLTLVVGALVGWLCWRRLRAFGPAVVVALAGAALAASFAAASVGERPGRQELRDALDAGTPGRLDAPVRLRADEATVAWPLGALAGFLLPLAYRRD